MIKVSEGDLNFGQYSPTKVYNMDFRKGEGLALKKRLGLPANQIRKKAKYMIEENERINGNQSIILTKKKEYDVKSIIKIQSCIRMRNVKKNIGIKGPGFYCRDLSINKNDFFTFENVRDISDKYFFSYKDTDGYIYSFDIRSLHKLLENAEENPYNRKKIPEELKEKVKNIVNNINNIEEFEKPKLDKHQEYKQRVISLFQKIDELDHYTNVEWFYNLSLYQIHLFYKEAEDLWNYRLQDLPAEKRNSIIPNDSVVNKVVFSISVGDFYKVKDIYKARMLMLDEIEKFITLGVNREDKVMGAMYILTALVLVSNEAAIALPWLVQPN